jgi:hypothetical protein
MSAKRLVLCAGACVAAAAIGSTAMASPPVLECVLGRDARIGGDGFAHGVPGCDHEVIRILQVDTPSIDNNGNVIFRASLDTSGSIAGSSATNFNKQIYLYGGPAGSANPIHLIARDGGTYGSGDWPHLSNINGWVTNSLSTGPGPGLSSSPSVTPGGVLFMAAQMNGTGATSSNNSGFWTGIEGSLTQPVAQVAQQGFLPGPNGTAPGTSGAVWNNSLGLALATGFTPCNDAGQVVFKSTLTGGDVSAGVNDDAMFVGRPGTITMIARKGTTGLTFEKSSGTSVDATGLALGATTSFGMSMNHQGEVAYVGSLLDGSGGGTVTSDNDTSIWTNLGGTFRCIARKGDRTAWDLGNGPTYHNDFKPTLSPFGQLSQAMSRNHSYFTIITLGLFTTPGVNDQVLVKYHWDSGSNTGAWTPLIYMGDPCPLVTGALWGGFAAGSTRCASNDGMLIGAYLQDDGSGTIITNTNDQCLCWMPAGQSPVLVARLGSLLTDFGYPINLPSLPSDAKFVWPTGTGGGLGGLLNQESTGGYNVNANGQVTFRCYISGTNVTSANNVCLFLWDPVEGLMLLARTGSTSLTFNGAPGTAAKLKILGSATGEGTGPAMTDNGWFAFLAEDATGNDSVYRVQIPYSNCNSSDFNHDGDFGTDADIEAFFACLGGNCCPACGSADFNHDGDIGTDADIEAFFRVLAGGAC